MTIIPWENTMRLKCVLLIIPVLGYATAEGTDKAACCPPSMDILSTDNRTCWNSSTNATTPIRFECLKIMIRSYEYKVVGDKIELHLASFFKHTLELKDVCTGNIVSVENGTITKIEPDQILLCQNDLNEGKDDSPISRDTYGYCLAVSVVFMAITAIIYAVLSELRDLFGKSVINLCTASAIGFGLLSIQQLMPYSDMTMCAVRGFLCYFFLLAAFFWSNSIAIQVLRETRRPITVDYGWREFRWFMLYSWGVPVLLTMCTAIVNFHPGDHSKPGIGLNTCWFFDNKQQWYYMYSVLSILILTNIGIFIYISLKVWRLTFASSHVKALKYKFSMTIKLVIVMGLSWIFEMAGSLSESHILWSIMDLFNCIQGIFLFLILVVFRKKVIKALYKRGWLGCFSGFVERRLAVGDDDEDNVVQHTDIPMNYDR